MYEYIVGYVFFFFLRVLWEGGEGVVGWWGVSMVICNYRLIFFLLEVFVI